MRRALLLIALFATLFSAGCGDSALPEATGKGSIRAINAISDSPVMSFLIEERALGSMDYKGATAATNFDDFSYRFNFDVVYPGASDRTRIASLEQKITAERDYVFMISGTLNSPSIAVWEADIRSWSGTETVFEARFGHTAASTGPVDVYFAAPGVAPATGNQVATLSFGEVSAVADFAAEDYVLIITRAGDPADILFESASSTFTAQTSNIITPFDGDGNDLGPIAVRRIVTSGTSIPLGGVNELPTIRFIHASTALPAADVYLDTALTTAVASIQMPGDVSADIANAAGDTTITYTAAGNAGATLFEQQFSFAAGTRTDYYAIGESGSYQAVSIAADRQPIGTGAKLFLLSGSNNHNLLDLYVVDAGTSIADVTATTNSVGTGASSGRLQLAAGNYDIYVTTAGEKTVLAGPHSLAVSVGDIVEGVIVDTVDPATAEIRILP